MKEPSQLGKIFEEAVERDSRFIRHRDNVQYLCCFRTIGGRVFAFERVTKGHINLWLPEDERVKAAAETAGLDVKLTTPWPDPTDPERYGRISKLKSIPKLADKPLYKVALTTPGEAIAVLSALY